MENKAPSLWDGKTETSKGLRPPNTPRSVLLKDETKTSPNAESVGRASLSSATENDSKRTTFKLSADAPEFIPLCYQTPTPLNNSRSSVQNRLNKHKSAQPNSPEQPRTSELGAEFEGSAEDIRLRNIIETLTKDPGQFENLLELFMATLHPYFEDLLVLSRAANLLVDQATDYPSFRYTAARLCCHIEQHCPEFRAELHLTCQKKMNDHTNKSGLLLFVAELYTQLHFANIYGYYLIGAYEHLLTLGGNENVKCICQALKLTGYSLEQYDKKALDDVFIKLNEIKSSVTGTALSLINSVINLRSSRWGHDSPVNSTSDNAESEPVIWDDHAPIFCAADGTSFTTEESDFLAAHMNAAEDYLTDTSDPDELCDPEPEMDEEIQAAFKDFVKLSKR